MSSWLWFLGGMSLKVMNDIFKIQTTVFLITLVTTSIFYLTFELLELINM